MSLISGWREEVISLSHFNKLGDDIKAGLYRIWCGVHRLGDCGVHTLGDTSAFVNPAGQLSLIAG